MSEPERPWFRFHLLTAVLMMLAAGMLIWENIKHFRYPQMNGAAHQFGWPWIGMLYWTSNLHAFNGPDPREQGYFNAWFFAADFACGIAALVAVAFISEWLIRRRKDRRQ